MTTWAENKRAESQREAMLHLEAVTQRASSKPIAAALGCAELPQLNVQKGQGQRIKPTRPKLGYGSAECATVITFRFALRNVTIVISLGSAQMRRRGGERSPKETQVTRPNIGAPLRRRLASARVASAREKRSRRQLGDCSSSAR
ncbi:hypothetical protein SKAU_G00315180 [Synaphobranchus kaupii]|uniref:Uncharacterized protein n=1 Tax=Synaphobranchus kaupii TaxID=118154 RepID=A0A9Q1ESM1_SYNKA|nr:hypothetical protein SKAU_G00315180 [Synaphobranchus kaupii]